MGIVKLTNLQEIRKKGSLRLWQFEGYWQVKLGTFHPHGLNDINELKNGFKNFEISKDRKMHKLNINHAQPLLQKLYLIIFNFIYGRIFTLWPLY